MTFVTIEDDNSEHLISHDELGACMNSKKYKKILKKKKEEYIFQWDSVKLVEPIPSRNLN